MATGEQKKISLGEFPSPGFLYDRQYGNDAAGDADYRRILETPYYYGEETHSPRNYQRIAINRAVEFIAKGGKRALLVMAAGTGKTYMAFQII